MVPIIPTTKIMFRVIGALLCIGCVNFGESANILGVYNHPGSSHTLLGKILLKALAEKGHNVTMISAYPLEKPIPNYTDINLVGFIEDLKERQKMYFGSALEGHKQTMNMSLQHTTDTFKNSEVKKLLSSNQTFDLIIMDYFYNEGSLIFGHHFKAPVIIMCSFGNNILLNSITGNSLPYAYVPGAALMTSDNLTFVHRLIMTMFNTLIPIFQTSRLNTHENMLKKYFDNPPSMDELKRNVALILSNSHVSFESPRPFTPNVIPIGGFHVQKPGPLPSELKKYLDNAKKGVVFFSLGSQIKSSNLKQSTFEAIIKTFSRLEQEVLLKWEGEDPPTVSKNVRFEKWLPQLSVLAHPNVKVFVTHGGLLSTIESIHFGVPMLFIPFNGDQPTNAAYVTSRKFGLIVKPDNLTEDTFYNTLNEIIVNPKFKQNAEYYSSILRNQPLHPLDLAIFWVEHVITHKGADHLKPYSLNLRWYQNYLIDVISFIFIVVFVFCVAIFILLYSVKKAIKFFIDWLKNLANHGKNSKKNK